MFKVDCGGDRFSDVSHLSDAQLASRLRELGADIGPIIDATRSVYQRKLQRCLQNCNPECNNIHVDETQEELEEARPLANRQASEPDPFSASLQHQDSPRQVDGYRRKLVEDVENSRCKESKEERFRDICKSTLPSADSLEMRARSSSSRSSNSLRCRSSHHETGEDGRMHGHNRTETGFGRGISSTSQRVSIATVSPAFIQPGSQCLPQQGQKHWVKKPSILVGLFVIMMLCLLFVLIAFNMEPEYQNPAVL